jgi:hypothetical protein
MRARHRILSRWALFSLRGSPDVGLLEIARVLGKVRRRKLDDLGTGGGAGGITKKFQNLPKYYALYRSEAYQPVAHVSLAEPYGLTEPLQMPL